MHKSIDCGSVRKTHLGQEVVIAGWVHRRRDHGNIIFLDLRDQQGLVQVVFDPKSAPEAHITAESVRNEWVLKIKGVVSNRPEGTINSDMPTGDVEVLASILTINCVSNINEITNLEESPIGDQPTLGQHISQLAIDNGNVELDLLIEHGSWLKIPELFHV